MAFISFRAILALFRHNEIQYFVHEKYTSVHMITHATYSLFFSLSLSLQPLFLGDSRTLEVEMFLNLWTKSKILNQFEADQNPLFYFSGMYTCK